MNSYSTHSSRFDVGDVVQVFFPFSDGEAGKPRPVLIVLPPDAKQDFLALAITGSGHHDHTMPLVQQDMASGHLSKASFIRVDKLYTVNALAVTQTFGKVKAPLLDKARKQMCAALGCR
jgi:mRNA-degrading endonuclease toxin of MazEF toxin-antitoxin module